MHATDEVVWTNTWPRDDQRHEDGDFSAWSAGDRIGRIYPVDTGAFGPVWKWFALFPCQPNAGQSGSRREAMLAIETAWERFRG